MSRLSTKQRRSRRRNGPRSIKMLCRPVVLSYAGLRFWLDDKGPSFQGVPVLPKGPLSEAVLNEAFDRLAAAEERAWSSIIRGCFGPVDEISHVEVLRRGLTSADLFAAGWYSCPEKDAWWRPGGA